MLKDFVLGIEIAELGNMAVANISMAIQERNLVEGEDYLKFGGITLFSKKTPNLPRNLENLLYRKELTDLSSYVPYSHFVETVNGKLSRLKDKFTKVQISGKQFVQITDSELYSVFMSNDLIRCVVPANDVKELVEDELIEGSMTLSNSETLVWYSRF